MTTTEWWALQLVESMKEASNLVDSFRDYLEPNIDELDKAALLYEDCCQAYKFNSISLEEFIELGESLRARQAHRIIQKDYTNG
ncbi:hypothetical protein [Candidatus Protochlamydia amoebophila]|uniref:hypothetical protein n=1 Tax=Candidatus Protochlamydia amoebophila TaxID=362787 RepID=UPI00057FE740|nr:hypothetical protein [Candidatus Protochlamydia amoebophila]